MFKKFGIVFGLFLLANLAVTSAWSAAPVTVATQQVDASPVAVKSPAVAQPSPPPHAPLPFVAGNYGFATATNGSLADMSAGTTQLVAANADDTASAVTNIGFDFFFQGVRYTQFSVNSNGVIRLGAVATSGSTPYKPLAQAGIPIITAYGADQRTHTTGKVHFKVTGAIPNRVLTIEWLNMQANFNSGGTVDLTYQVNLHEGTGVIDMIYGSMAMSTLGAADANSRDPNIGFSSDNMANTVGSVTAAQSGVPAPTFDGASATPVANLYTAGTITVLNSAAQGSRRVFTFTPPTPTAPTGVNFTMVTATSMTVNWTDSPDELGYAVYYSLDGINLTFAGTVAANGTSLNVTGLAPSTTYFWAVAAFSEGRLAAAAGMQMTAAPGNISSTAAGGLWSVPATWVGGVVPSSTDNVTIVNTATVTVDVTNAVCLNLTIDGVLQSPTAGAVINNNLTVGGNVTNNGTLDFSTNGDTSAAILTFGAGGANVTLGGAGATTDVRAIAVAKGAQATVVDVTVSNFTVQGVNTDVAGYLTITSGTFKISGTFAMTNRTFPGPTYAIPLLGGFWLNNPNYVVAATASAATTSNNGLLRASQGTYNIGIGAADQMRGGVGAVFILEGTAIINVSGAFDPQSAVTYTQTGGTMNVGVVGNNVSAFGTFELFSASTTFNMSGGTINIITPSTGATKVDYRNNASLATTTITGGTVVIGAAPAAAAGIYTASGTMPSTTINATETMRVNNAAIFMRGSTVTNNGIIDYTGASARYDFGSQVGAMTYGGAGIFGTAATPVAGVGVSANSLFLITLNAPIFANRINLFTGGFVNSGMITLGSGAASTTVVQTGSAGLLTPGGSFDASPVHNQGSGGQVVIYAQESAPRTTGVEVNPTRTLTTLSVSTTNGVTIAGGDIQVNGAAAGALTLTDAAVITGANTLYYNTAATVTRTLSGHVDGNFKKAYTAAASKVFEVGTANGYSPVTINATAGTFPTDITVKAVQGTEPTIMPANKAISRYWVLTAMGVTADLTFNYLDPLDIPGTVTEANLLVYRMETPAAPTNLGGMINTAANTATVTGVTQFSNWTLAESGATPVQLQDFSVE